MPLFGTLGNSIPFRRYFRGLSEVSRQHSTPYLISAVSRTHPRGGRFGACTLPTWSISMSFYAHGLCGRSLTDSPQMPLRNAVAVWPPRFPPRGSGGSGLNPRRSRGVKLRRCGGCAYDGTIGTQCAHAHLQHSKHARWPWPFRIPVESFTINQAPECTKCRDTLMVLYYYSRSIPAY